MSERKPRALAIDDDPQWLRLIPLILNDLCDIETARTIDEGVNYINRNFYDLILLDINFVGDERSGLDVFRFLQSLDRGADVIVISGETNPERLVEIMNAGITQFIPKPASNDKILNAVRSVLIRRDCRLKAIEGNFTKDDKRYLVGKSPAMTKLRQDLDFIIKSGVKDILIMGETGTGKELVAKYIAHKLDPSKRFIPVHCAAISDSLAESELFGHVKGAFTGAAGDKVGAFEAAGGGFVFLDEIGDMPISHQAKLLRVLQERKLQKVGSFDETSVSFRSISATHVNMEHRVGVGQFREDLYYRISKSTVTLPPLRERLEDIPELVHLFLGECNNPNLYFTDSALALLSGYHWPGNVRQLKSAIEFMAQRAQDGVIREREVFLAVPHLSRIYGDKANKAIVGRYGATVIIKEKERFAHALAESQGSREDAARLLGMSRASFFRRAKELGFIKPRKLKSQPQIEMPMTGL